MQRFIGWPLKKPIKNIIGESKIHHLDFAFADERIAA
jgi:hypothetical protein